MKRNHQNWAPDIVLIVSLIGIGVSVTIGLILLTPTILTASTYGPDSFFPKPVFTAVSPDEKHKIVVSNKIDFPVIDLLDPTTTISVELSNVNTFETTDHLEFGVYDICDLRNPTEVEWKHDRVVVRKTYNQKDKEIEFALK